ncbi:MAG: glycosyltransferase family 4 protein [Burkholderiales bacterium]|nr:glycosyltransferase family 4 protein [Burkholderiales bacterium]
MKKDLPLVGFNLMYIRPGYVGGTVRYALELLRHMQSQGRFRLIAFAQPGVVPMEDPQLKNVSVVERPVVAGLLGRVIYEHAILPLVARRHEVDLLFSPGFVSPLWGGFRKVATIHDLYYRLFPEFVRPWQRRYWQIMVPFSLRSVDAAIAVSDCTRTDIAVAYPWAKSKLRAIHPGADSLPAAQAEPVASTPYCLLVGNLTPNKDVETVLEAFSLLAARGVRCRLMIAGSDPDQVLRARRDTRTAAGDLELLARVDDGTLATLYAHALCLIQASRYEGFGLPAAEAMEMGCPVVASDIRVLREVCGPAALYFDVGSADALSRRIEQLVRDEAVRSSAVRTGRANARRFRWRQAADETSALFEQVLRRSGGGTATTDR